MTWSLAALIRRGSVEEYAFKVLLREVMLLVSFFLVTGSAAFGLALAWRRKRRREEDDAASSVDATSPPFFICVITLTMAISIAIALPATLVVLHELRVWESDWLDPIRLTKWLWLCLIHGSKACLFVLLPMAVLYQESDGGCGRGNSFVRFMAVLLEVVLVGVVVFCIMAVLEKWAINDNKAFTFPSTIISAALVLPGLGMFTLTAPNGSLYMLRFLSSKVLFFARMWQVWLFGTLESKVLDIEALVYKRAQLKRQLHAQEPETPPSSPTLLRLSQPTDDIESATQAPLRRRRQLPLIERPAGDSHMHLPSLFHDAPSSAAHAFVVSPSGLADPAPSAAALADVERHIAQASTDSEKLQRLADGLSPRVSKWQKVMWLLALLGYMTVFALALLRTISRPVVAVLMSFTQGTYSTLECMLDVMTIVFYTMCACYGVYSNSSSTPNSLMWRWFRPRVADTPMFALLANAALMLTMAFALPLVVWIFGIGHWEDMRYISKYYGDFSLLQNKVVTTCYIILNAAVILKLIVVNFSSEFKWLYRQGQHPVF